MTVEVTTTGSTQYPLLCLWNKNASRARVATLIVALEWVALMAGVVYLGGRTLPRAWEKLDTDFPNYYLTARLLREGYNTDRVYEWVWIQRQKDRIGIQKADQPLVAFVPNPPFSALLVWPLTYWTPLTAKHIWIALNLALVVAVALLLQSLTSLAWRRIALLIVLTFPLHRNLLYGQYYILLLVVFTLSLWFYVRQRRVPAGFLLGIGFGLKIFPALFLLYFLRKKDFKAAAGLVIGSAGAALASVAAFGVVLNRTYFLQVLPWALRGEVMDPYNLSASSLSALLHHFLIFEREWNPHPLLHVPVVFAMLHPLLQLLVLSPAILLAVPHDMHPRQLRLEWAAYLAGLLAISTMPASYHFTILILPMSIMAAVLIEDKRFPALTFLLFLYLGIGFPLWKTAFGGAREFMTAPRLFLVISFCLFSWVLLWQQQPFCHYRRDLRVWSTVLACILILEVAATVHHQRGIYDPASERLFTLPAAFLAVEPVAHNDSILFISMLADGYHAAQRTDDRVQLSDTGLDLLALTAAGDKLWVEEAGRESRIVSIGSDLRGGRLEVDYAEVPVASRNGKRLAYLRSERGRSQMWLRALSDHVVDDKPITPPDLNVLEMSFFPDNSLVFAAAKEHQAPHLFLTQGHDALPQVIPVGEARYPSVSPDGQWLAYARQSHGVWNLWLRNMQTAEETRITSADCNDVSPSWEADSKTLLFASDCGRALGLTALYRRRVLP